MKNKYHVDFTGWISINASTPQEAADVIHRVLENTGAIVMIDGVEEVGEL